MPVTCSTSAFMRRAEFVGLSSRSTARTSWSASSSSSAMSHASDALMISKYWSIATAANPISEA